MIRPLAALLLFMMSSLASADFVLVPATLRMEVYQNLIEPYSAAKVTAIYDADSGRIAELTYVINGKSFNVPQSFLGSIENPDMRSLTFAWDGYLKDMRILILLDSHCDESPGGAGQMECKRFSLDITENARSAMQEAR